MRRISLAFIILLLAISYGCKADVNQHGEKEHTKKVSRLEQSGETEQAAKVRQLEKVAERFKAETGFRGEINYDYTRMKLQSFEGKFTDISFSADADTSAFRQACNSILDKILPYSFAKRSQLSMNRINRQGNYTSTDYIQLVNGYRVDSSGFIVITYDAGRNRFDIGDNSFKLPSQNITPVLTYEDAVRIYDENVKDDESIKKIRKERPFLGLRYSNIYNDWEGDTRSEYRLCWVGGYTRCIYIDALTGQVYKIVDMTQNGG